MFAQNKNITEVDEFQVNLEKNSEYNHKKHASENMDLEHSKSTSPGNTNVNIYFLFFYFTSHL